MNIANLSKPTLSIILILSAFGPDSGVRADPVIWYFSGPLEIRESSPGATYDSVQITELIGGRFTIGGTAGEGGFFAPDTTAEVDVTGVGSNYFVRIED
jgi:hypothetical protein